MKFTGKNRFYRIFLKTILLVFFGFCFLYGPLLKSNTQAITVSSGDQSSQAYRFVSDTTVSFLVFGDWGWKGEHQQRPVARQMAAEASRLNSDFVISTGDNFYYDGVKNIHDPHWQSSFEKVYTDSALMIPWYITLGNHDYNGSVQAQLDYTDSSLRWTLPSRYYSFVKEVNDSTTAQFIVLDSEMSGTEERQRQWKWLDSTLSSFTAEWKIVVGHRPIYTAGRAGNTPHLVDSVKPLLEKHEVQAYFCGHDHDLQYLKPAGPVHYFVSGAGGKPRSTSTGENKYSKFNSEETAGFISVALSAANMTVRYIDASGNMLYQTTLLPRSTVTYQ